MDAATRLILEAEVLMPRKAKNLKFSSFSLETFGSALKAARESKGITRTDFARNLGVSRSSLTMWESGQRVPEGDVLAGICTQLLLDANVLLGLDFVHTSGDVKERIGRLILSEGTEALGKAIGMDADAIDHILKGDLFAPTSKGLQAVASAYDLTVEWLLSGDPRHWAGSLTDFPGRLRFFTVCYGIPSGHREMIEALYSGMGTQRVTVDGVEVGSLEGLLRALSSVHASSSDFPFDLTWIVRG
jgi:transcriptional regulator with XRE-family HTH domain